MNRKAKTRSLTWPILLAAATALLVVIVAWSIRSIVCALQESPAETAAVTAATEPGIARDTAPAIPAAPPPAQPPPWFTASNSPVNDPAQQRRIDYLNTVKRLREEARESPAAERVKIENRIRQLEESNAVPR